MDKKLVNLRPEQILWLDLEMTGLSVDDDLILEVAAIATDWDFKELATYQGVIKNKVLLLKKQLAKNSSFWDINPGSRDSLIKQNQDGKRLREIEDELLTFVDKNFKAGIPILLGGNSIHMDRQFIAKNWPRFNSKLHYRMLDVSAWKVVFDGKFKKKFAKMDAHRALDDIRGSIEELKYYLNMVKK